MPRPVTEEYRFGPFLLDPVRGRLRREKSKVSADMRLIRLLVALVERRGRMVSREFLQRKLWPGHQNLRDGNLDVLVCHVRKLLRDNPRNPRFIRTHRTRGYQFVCPVGTIPALATDKIARSRAIAACEKARHRWSLRTPATIRESIQLYKQAIKEDPTFALAWSGRADAWIMAGVHCLVPPAEAFLRARSDATDALRITPNLPEAIISEAWVKLCFDRDIEGARKEFEAALRRKPEYPFTHNGLTLLHIANGQPQRAAVSMQKAWTLRASSPFLNALLADSLYHARNYERAAERGRLAIEFDPDLAIGHACVGRILLQQGHFTEAVKHLERARDLSGGSHVMLGFLAYGYALTGKMSEARRILKDFLKQRSTKTQYVPAFFVALAYVGLGDRKRAFAEIRRAVEERSHWVLFLKTDPMFDPLRQDRRFLSVVKMI